jgi:serine/threonine-protein kinase
VVQQDGTVLGGRFDLDQLRFRETPATLFTGVQVELGITPDFTLADDGTLVYLASNQTGTSAMLARVDRTGGTRLLAPTWLPRFSSIALSPDGRRVALSTLEQSRNNVWMKQLDDGPLTQLSFDGTINYRPAWLADGRSISFTSDARDGRSYLYRMRADGSDKPQRIFPNDTTQIDEALWSRDGRWLVYRSGVTGGVRDIFARRTEGDTARITVSAGAADEYMPALSPDGRWIAYVSVESGREEVYVRPFPETGRARWQISVAGGANPLWSNSGRELFYVDMSDSLVAVSVSGTPDFQPGSRRALFSTRPFILLPLHRSYDVMPDDQSFVMLKRSLAGSAEANRLTVVLNWFTEVEAKVRQDR